MKVKAKFKNGKFGFNQETGRRVYDGDIFHIDEKQFSDKWMIKLEDDKPRRGRPPAETVKTDAGEGAE